MRVQRWVEHKAEGIRRAERDDRFRRTQKGGKTRDVWQLPLPKGQAPEEWARSEEGGVSTIELKLVN